MSENPVPWAFITHLMYALKLDDKQCQLIGDVAAQWGSDMFACHRQIALGESPMERLFLLAAYLNGSVVTAWGEHDEKSLWAQHIATGMYFHAQPQFEVRDDDDAVQATVDFRLVSASASILVEIDGHDFHEKTKDQVARDKRRERRIARCGGRVLRFSGAEIWADPVACLNEAVEALLVIGERLQRKLIQPREQAAFDRGYAHRDQALALPQAEAAE